MCSCSPIDFLIIWNNKSSFFAEVKLMGFLSFATKRPLNSDVQLLVRLDKIQVSMSFFSPLDSLSCQTSSLNVAQSFPTHWATTICSMMKLRSIVGGGGWVEISIIQKFYQRQKYLSLMCRHTSEHHWAYNKHILRKIMFFSHGWKPTLP